MRSLCSRRFINSSLMPCSVTTKKPTCRSRQRRRLPATPVRAMGGASSQASRSWAASSETSGLRPSSCKLQGSRGADHASSRHLLLFPEQSLRLLQVRTSSLSLGAAQRLQHPFSSQGRVNPGLKEALEADRRHLPLIGIAAVEVSNARHDPTMQGFQRAACGKKWKGQFSLHRPGLWSKHPAVRPWLKKAQRWVAPTLHNGGCFMLSAFNRF